MDDRKSWISVLLTPLVFGATFVLADDYKLATKLQCAVIGNPDGQGLQVFRGAGIPLKFSDALGTTTLENDNLGEVSCIITHGPVSDDDSKTIMDYLSKYSARWLSVNWGGPNEGDRKPATDTSLVVPVTEDTEFLSGTTTRGKAWDCPDVTYDYVQSPDDMTTIVSLNSDPNEAVMYVNSESDVGYVLSDMVDSSICGLALQYAALFWVTKGSFLGKVQISLSPQIDDMFLSDDMFNRTDHLVGPDDVDWHITWKDDWNNQHGDSLKFNLCVNDMAIFHGGNTSNFEWGDPFDNDERAPDDYVKVGDNPPHYTRPWEDKWWETTNWNEWFDKFPLAKMAATDRWAKNFNWMSHTMTHVNMAILDNADAKLELEYNEQSALAAFHFDKAGTWSRGVILGEYSGLQNGNVIKAMADLGIKSTLSQNDYAAHNYTAEDNNNYLPFITKLETNGYAGLALIPRWNTLIAWDAANADINLAIWQMFGYPEFNTTDDLLKYDSGFLVPKIMSLRQDPLMYHQANMNTFTYNGKKQSLLTLHVSTLAEKMHEYLDLPFISHKHDDLAGIFTDRLALQNCNPEVVMQRGDGENVNYLKISVPSGSSEGCKVPLEGIPLPSMNGAVTDSFGKVFVNVQPGDVKEFGTMVCNDEDDVDCVSEAPEPIDRNPNSNNAPNNESNSPVEGGSVDSKGSSASSIPVVVGSVIGAAVFVGLVGVGFVVYRRRNGTFDTSSQTSENDPNNRV
eukprot:Clim_evm17s46 gene=Clim_evmTU17s46